MNQVNFLPESFIKGRARRGRIARQVMLVGVVAAGLAVWSILVHTQLAQKKDQVHEIEDQVIAARNMQTATNQLRAEHAELAHRIAIQRELSQSVTHTDVIASIADIIPHKIALTELSMITTRRKPAAIVPENAKRSRKRQKMDAQQVEEVHIKIELQALSPDGASVANLVEAFSEHPLITEVTMRHTRVHEVRGVMAREFRLEMTIDLNRRFLNADDEGKEVALAD